jgi:hypothetical protein
MHFMNGDGQFSGWFYSVFLFSFRSSAMPPSAMPPVAAATKAASTAKAKNKTKDVSGSEKTEHRAMVRCVFDA